jgi:hypothetical protein
MYYVIKKIRGLVVEKRVTTRCTYPCKVPFGNPGRKLQTATASMRRLLLVIRWGDDDYGSFYVCTRIASGERSHGSQ